MAATGMKLKQAGLVKKPMYVVPNHLLEQVRHEVAEVIDWTEWKRCQSYHSVGSSPVAHAGTAMVRYEAAMTMHAGKPTGIREKTGASASITADGRLGWTNRPTQVNHR
jgi:N12 class adenine-specific DNA methylase